MKKTEYSSFLISLVLHAAVIAYGSIMYSARFPIPAIKLKENNVIKISKFMLTKKTVSDSMNENVVDHEVQSNVLGSENNLPSHQSEYKESVSGNSSEVIKEELDSNEGISNKKKEIAESKSFNDNAKTNNIKTKKFKYFKFYKENKVNIDKIWDKLLSKNKFKKSDDLEVLVLLKVNRLGHILDISIDKSSLNGKFDKLALNVFKKKNKIIAPPVELFEKNEYLYIQWYFSLKN